jgi:hypothetical protein
MKRDNRFVPGDISKFFFPFAHKNGPRRKKFASAYTAMPRFVLGPS